jgi:hypothetical protein
MLGLEYKVLSVQLNISRLSVEGKEKGEKTVVMGSKVLI